jgi:hypothetical protein
MKAMLFYRACDGDRYVFPSDVVMNTFCTEKMASLEETSLARLLCRRDEMG